MGTYNLSNFNNIDSLLSLGRKWGAGNTGTGATVTYNFSNQVDKTHNPLTNAQRQRVRGAFNAWSEIANVQFTESTNPSQITLFGVTSSGGQTRPSWNNTGIIHADIDLGSQYDFASGDYSYGSVLLHEIGHAIGLKHPHDNGENGFNVVANQDIDSTLFSVMSYRSYVGQPDPGTLRQTFYPTTPMLNDIAAIQYIYGANWNTRNGNTIYRWNSGQQILETIWDGGGIDTIDWSNQSSNASINLNAGAWSQLGSGYTITRTDGTSFVENRTLAIAFGVTIENATGGTGNDTINGNQVGNVLQGGNGNDKLYGGNGNDKLYGGNGDDYLDGGSGGDYMYGGNGSDTYVVDSLGDVVVDDPRLTNATGQIIGGVGTDTVKSYISYTLPNNVENLDFNFTFLNISNLNGAGNNLNNYLLGNRGKNILSGLEGDDTLSGGAGDDILNGGIGNDFMDGWTGNDTYVVDSLGDVVVEDPRLGAQGGNDTVQSSIDYTLPDYVENLTLTGTANLNGTGNNLNNSLLGNNGNNYLYGLAGNDTLDGSSGDDYLAGGDGNDSLIGGLDQDALVGGEGNDQLYGGDGDDNLDGEAGNNIIDGGAGYDILAGSGSLNYTLTNTQLIGQGTDTFANIETVYLYGDGNNNTFDATGFTIGNVVLYGGAGNDLLSGGAKDDLIYGEEGADRLSGSVGNDYLVGGEGDDSLIGGLGNDQLAGDIGKDTLLGGQGVDNLEGGDGSDLFSFAAPTEGIDLIADFVSGVDKIGINKAGFGGGLLAGLLSNSQFVLGTTASDGTDRFIYDQGTGSLFFDKDGTGATAQVQFATLSNFSALSASDILVV